MNEPDAVIVVHKLREAVAFLTVCCRSGEHDGADHPLVGRAIEMASAYTAGKPVVTDEMVERAIWAFDDVAEVDVGWRLPDGEGFDRKAMRAALLAALDGER